MTTVTNDVILDAVRAVQRDIRQVVSTLPELLGVINRQGNRLERELADLRAELWRVREVVDPVDRTEPGDAFANFERRIDNHLDRHSAEMRAMLREELGPLGAGDQNRSRKR
jgi:ABC-type transporter Mla subunit MlaD